MNDPDDRKGRHYMLARFALETCSGDSCGHQDHSQTLQRTVHHHYSAGLSTLMKDLSPYSHIIQ